MSAAIELLTRMHCVKNTMFEDCKGRHSLTGDVIIGAFGLVQHKHPMGMHLLMARYLDDARAKRQAQLGIEKWLKLIEHNGGYEMAACYLALEVFLEKPIGNQPKTLATLWRNHGSQAKHSDALIRRWQADIKKLNRQLDIAETQAQHDRIESSIRKKEIDIAAEKSRLRNYASQQAQTRLDCPKCSGTGKTLVTLCNVCNATGKLMPTPKNVVQHLKASGFVFTELQWEKRIKPLFERCLSMLYVESNMASDCLSKQLNLEKQGENNHHITQIFYC